MISPYEFLRARLLDLGPSHPVLKAAIRVQAGLHGFHVSRDGTDLTIARGNRCMRLPGDQVALIPSAVHCWELYFRTVVPTRQGQTELLDFSVPRIHHYRGLDADLWVPGVAEEDSGEAYTRHYRPKAGDVIWDVGAHAGATTLLFSRMIGTEGRVFAFEPDTKAHTYLLRNIEMHQLANVTPVSAALAHETGMRAFTMDGSQGAGLVGLSQYAESSRTSQVQCYSLADACAHFGVPTFVKMDIEGAEAAVIEGGAEFLRGHSIRFAIETEHRVDGVFTSIPVTRAFTALGYEVVTERIEGQRFTWAAPPD